MKLVYKTITDFTDKPSQDETEPTFIQLLKSKWDEIHNKPNIFRYKINNIRERIVDEKYLLQLNPDRSTNRRTPELINNMSQPFSEEKFNFTKVSSNEVMFSVGKSVDDPDLHSFIVNVSPITKYHTLLCPFINKKLPQVVTEESLYVAIKILFVANDSNLKIGFNSLCALASVNHLHFHLFMESNVLPVEKVEWRCLPGNLSYLSKYPAPAFCFRIHDSSKDQVNKTYRVIKYLQDECIAHNIFIKMTATLEAVEVYVYPRKSTTGAKQLSEFNVALLELSGCFPVHNEEAFNTLKSEELEDEMKKWIYNDFDNLLKKLQSFLL